ncbi:hypothetical protein LVD17_17640 [Fulvivirga ulvae]|uniref:hypothetical protein n=1 Tax=Fulvivirga ulvae TaxID=2904245 RepID=UPI001F48E946|nr:hypothetical protein [Fulvivirga ulvae]UII30122.1 hypothetical protein LVD17_17640 [Fulvivirga ulvae]
MPSTILLGIITEALEVKNLEWNTMDGIQLFLIINSLLMMDLIIQDQSLSSSKLFNHQTTTKQISEPNHIKDELGSLKKSMEHLKKENYSRHLRIEQLQEQITRYLFLAGHKIRGPLARILGIINLFDKDALNESERKLLFQELKNSSMELDEEIRKTNEILYEDINSISTPELT